MSPDSFQLRLKMEEMTVEMNSRRKGEVEELEEKLASVTQELQQVQKDLNRSNQESATTKKEQAKMQSSLEYVREELKSVEEKLKQSSEKNQKLIADLDAQSSANSKQVSPSTTSRSDSTIDLRVVL